MERYFKEIVDNQLDSKDGFKHLSMSDIIKKYAIDENPKNFKMHIGTGFFFISGFNSIKDYLKNSKYELGNDEYLKIWGTKAPFLILIGKETNNYTKTVLKNLSKKNIEEEFKKNISYLKNEDIKVLKELYKNNYIKFKVFTERKFHVKIYFFLEDNIIKDIYAGSANLTPNGLIYNLEFSAPISADTTMKKQYHNWFKSLWDNATDNFNVLKVIEEYTKEDFIYLEPKTFFINLLSKLKDRRYLFNNTENNENSILLEFQKLDTINVFNKLNENGGCILASSVGLGKSFVALEVMRYYLSLSKKVLLIAPTSILETNWKKDYLKYYDLIGNPNLICLGEGKLRRKLNDTFFNDYKDFDLIVVDEAHFLRNLETNVRQNFNKIYDLSSSDSKLLFLTATPINTKIKNLINLLDIWFKKNIGKYHNNVELLKNYERFRELSRRVEVYKNASIKERIEMMKLMEILKNNFVVQTMRQDLKKYFKSDLERISGSSEIIDPDVEEIKYNYSKEYREEIFNDIVNFLSNLTYENSKFQYKENTKEWLYKEDKNLTNLYRWNLYKGLESSLYAFYKSLINHKNKIKLYLDFFKTGDKKIIDNYIKLNKVGSKNKFKDYLIRIKKEIFDKKDVLKISKKRVLENLENDFELCSEYILRLEKYKKKESKLFKNDLKLKKLEELLFLYKEKKWIIFSERKETINMLKEYFNKKNLNYVSITGNDDSIEKNSKIKKFKIGKYKYILATDALSQGFNLAEADGVINFDLPYNPVILIQRSGRVTRLDVKKKVFLKNFNPSDEINKELELIEKLDLRIENIINFMGIDYSIWKKHEDLIKKANKKHEIKIGDVLKSLRKARATEDPENLNPISIFSKSQKLDTLLKRAIDKYQITEEDLLNKTPNKPFFTSLKDISNENNFFGIFNDLNNKIGEFGDIHIENTIIEGEKKEYDIKKINEFLKYIKDNKINKLKKTVLINDKYTKEYEKKIIFIKDSNLDYEFISKLLFFNKNKIYERDVLDFYDEIYFILKSKDGFNKIRDREIYKNWIKKFNELYNKYKNYKDETKIISEYDKKLSDYKSDIIAFINYEG